MTQPAPAPAPTPPAPTPTPTPPAAPPTPPVPAAPPTYVPPPSMAPPAPAAPPGPVYVPAVPVPPAPVEPDDGTRDPAKLPQWVQTELAKLKDENAKRRIEARSAVVTQHAQFAAIQLGANPAALLGSTAFSAISAQLDPHAADFPAKLTEAINQTLAANPWMAAAPASTPGAPAAPPAPPASGVDFSGTGAAGLPITEQQLAQMTPIEIEKAYAEGRLKHLL